MALENSQHLSWATLGKHSMLQKQRPGVTAGQPDSERQSLKGDPRSPSPTKLVRILIYQLPVTIANPQ